MIKENMELSNFTISSQSSCIDVLKKIDSLPNIQTVFVIDGNKKVIGSITDGDIRRGLINQLGLSSPITDFMNKGVGFLKDGDDNFAKFKYFRKKRFKAVPFLSKAGRLLKIFDFTITKSLLPIDAVIMAGGKGMRLRPLTNDIPKPLLRVGDQEIISYNINRLFQFGIVNQSIAVNYLGAEIEEYCDAYHNKEIRFNIIRESEYLGTAGALSLIDNFQNEVILLMNSDLLTNIDYEDFYKSFLEKDADIMVASIPYQVNLPYAIFDTDNRKVKDFKEKPNYTYYANAGIYLIKKNLLGYVPKNEPYNATDLMKLVIEKGGKLIHYPIRSYWLDIGKHEDFEKAQKDIAHINWD